MNERLEAILEEENRAREFPVVTNTAFMAHAGVSPLPRVAAEALRDFALQGSTDSQETDRILQEVPRARKTAAELIGARADEIALLGPTSLGLSLVANGLPWEAGDEVVYYQDDYPANVYSWSSLKSRGVRPVPLEPEKPGLITWETVDRVLSSKTRLVALATCNFISGYRCDVEAIGARLHERGVLFCVDGIQTLGAFPLAVEHIDFLSADSHKWMLGPNGAGILYVKRSRQEQLEPTLLGAWNVLSPNYIAQHEIRYHPGARRYEPGTLNIPGILSMLASLRLLLEIGIEDVARRILDLRRHLVESVRPLGYRLYLEDWGLSAEDESGASGIIPLIHPGRDVAGVAGTLDDEGIRVSLRHDREGRPVLRFSPHFYNTFEEIDRAVSLMGGST